MDRITLTPSALEHQARAPQPDAAPFARELDKQTADPTPAIEPSAKSLQVQLDKDAGRFVQTLTDASTHETLRKYPSEAQLAYSRAVMAYMRALTQP
ncbi:MAG: hypothetical protein JNM59_10065 [Hyphomonadaceae bacterium]|nr:hypothetical protein [Hyphomonadaceae bacterium]